MLCSAIAATLSVCVLVPVDSKTGLPVQTHSTSTVIVSPPVSQPAAASVLTARLYPLNETAQRAGLLNAVIVDNHNGRGTITLG